MEELKKIIAGFEELKSQAEKVELKKASISEIVVLYTRKGTDTIYAVTEEPLNQMAEGEGKYLTIMPSVGQIKIFKSEEAEEYVSKYPEIFDGKGNKYIAERWNADSYRNKLVSHYNMTIWFLKQYLKGGGL